MTKTVKIEAPARLHWGMFDVSGTLGRRFGGLGVAINRPAVILEAATSGRLTAQGPTADRVLEFAGTYLSNTGVQAGATLRIEQTIPGHVGLGSGTKLALAVAYALAMLYGHSTDPHALARAVGRKTRSAVGLWTFAQGGLVVEGGRHPDRRNSAPLLLRYPMPADWYCVLAIPDRIPLISGKVEIAAFEKLSPTAEQAAKITHVVLMSLLPALVEEDIVEFGAALTQVQRLVGDCFSPAQGGSFSNPLSAQVIDAFLRWGAAGAGQSSWGPAVYGLVEGQTQGRRLVDRTREMLGGRGTVELVSFDNRGARVANAYDMPALAAPIYSWLTDN
jgi:beta-RFAP synthase